MIERVRWFLNPLKKRFASRALILLYHRIAELPCDPQLLCVTTHNFGRHLEILNEKSCAMQLQQLIRGLEEGDFPHQSVVVTFDDGYADNLYNAKPLLERYNIPATVFVAAAYIEDQRIFWWDELERILLQPGSLPETLHLAVDGIVYHWELGEAANYREDAYLRHRAWNVLENEDPTPRHRLYRSLYQILRFLPERSQRRVLEELMLWARAESTDSTPYRTLSPNELIRLVDGNLIEVGSHTVTHPTLSILPADEQRSEILESKPRLERILGRSVTTFSYPYGLRSDYEEVTIDFVRESGFACACSNFASVVSRRTDRFQLPRILVRNWDEEEFARRLRKWFDA